MAGIGLREKLLAAVTDVNLFYVILTLCRMTLAEQSGDGSDDEGVPVSSATATPPAVCLSNAFACYQDCCPKGDWFCHYGQQRCIHCATRKLLCGNESLPLECLLYCYKLLNPQIGCHNNPDSVCVSWSTFIAVVATVGAVAVSLMVLVIRLCVCARQQQWPACHRAVLGLNTQQHVLNDQVQNKKDPNATEEHVPMLHPPNQITRDVDAGRPLADHEISSSPSRPPSSASDNNTPSADMEDLNLTRVSDEDSDDGEETRGGPVNDDGSPPRTTSSRGTQGPGQPDTSTGSSGGRVQPPQGQELGANTEDPAGGRGGPGTPRGSCGGQGWSQEGPDSTTDTDTGRRPFGNDGGPARMTLTASEGGAPTHHGPDPSRDFEVRSPDSPDRVPVLARHVPAEGPHHPGSSRASPQAGVGLNVNEVFNKPDFSMMNPTAIFNDDQCYVIATGASNPVENYRNYTMQRLDDPQ